MDNSKYKEINLLFIECQEGKCSFETLLKACYPYFETIANNNPDPCEAISRMSVGLYKLIKIYDSSRGKPMAFIRTMCRHKGFDVNRKHKKDKYITFDTDLVTNVDLVDDDDEGIHDYSELSVEIDAVISKADYLTDSQSNRIGGGICPILTEERSAKLRADLLCCKHIREWYDE